MVKLINLFRNLGEYNNLCCSGGFYFFFGVNTAHLMYTNTEFFAKCQVEPLETFISTRKRMELELEPTRHNKIQQYLNLLYTHRSVFSLFYRQSSFRKLARRSSKKGKGAGTRPPLNQMDSIDSFRSHHLLETGTTMFGPVAYLRGTATLVAPESGLSAFAWNAFFQFH